MKVSLILLVIVAFTVLSESAMPVLADPPGPAVLTPEQKAAAEQARQDKMESDLKQFIADLKSNDPAKVSAAIATFHSVIMQQTREFDYNRAMDAMLAAKKYAELETMCQESMIANAEYPWVLWRVAKMRGQALLADGKPVEALAAAKQYYNVCPLAQTGDAISFVATVLVKARPEEKGIGGRFKRQQIALSASSGQALSTSSGQAPTTTPSTSSGQADDLGAPILPTITVDAKPFEEAISNEEPGEAYHTFVRKGNLLLLADRTAEARKLFEQGCEIAEGGDVQEAIENAARAIRAQTGSVGQANAFITSLQSKASAGK